MNPSAAAEDAKRSAMSFDNQVNHLRPSLTEVTNTASLNHQPFASKPQDGCSDNTAHGNEGKPANNREVEDLIARDLTKLSIEDKTCSPQSLYGTGLTPSPESEKKTSEYYSTDTATADINCYNSAFGANLTPSPAPARLPFNDDCSECDQGSPMDGFLFPRDDNAAGGANGFSRHLTPFTPELTHGCYVDRSPATNLAADLGTPETLMEATGLTPSPEPEPRGLPSQYSRLGVSLPCDVNMYTNSIFGTVLTPSPAAGERRPLPLEVIENSEAAKAAAEAE